VLSFANVVHLLANEFTRLGADRFTFPFVLPSALYGFFLRHAGLLWSEFVGAVHAWPLDGFATTIFDFSQPEALMVSPESSLLPATVSPEEGILRWTR
jgi:hypothetical protein